jgi:pimeloyl-ACP methyl ester carboxylesterase
MPVAHLPGVETYYEERGAGDPLVMLHPGGGGVDARALSAMVEALAGSYHVYVPERRAHGRTPDVEGAITFAAMAAETIAFIEQVVASPVRLFGYSDGAIVALHTTLERPDLVRRLAFVAGVFDVEGWHDGVLDGEPPAFLRASYGELSPDGIEHYDVVVAKLAEMHAREPRVTPDQLGGIACPTLVMLADDDQVRLEHAVEMYGCIADAELCVVPGTSHGLLNEKSSLCARLLADFLAGEPVRTLDPIRRRA